MNISDRWETIIIFQSTNDCIGPRRGWWMKLKMGSAGLGLVMGVLVFVVFTFVYGELWALIIGPERNKITIISGNVCAGLWAVVSSLLSALVLHQHILFSRGTLAQIYNPKRYNVQLRAWYNLNLTRWHYETTGQWQYREGQRNVVFSAWYYVFVDCRFRILLISGLVLLGLSLSATIYYFTMKIKLNQETYPIKERYK